jgi:peptidoglycan/LPS O-acetylase OafA/YrhL
MEARQESSNLDFLRSTAVLFVLGFHLLLYCQQTHHLQEVHIRRLNLDLIGHWGVLMFFVHTSLVLMLSLERQQLRFPGRPVYLSFLTRRIFRIFPLSIIIVLLVTALNIPGHLIDGQFVRVHWQATDILSNLLLLQNVLHTQSISAPLWSLPYEMQMYLVLPALYILTRFTRTAVPLLVAWAMAVSLAMWIYRMDVSVAEYTGLRPGFPDLLVYAPCFLSGVISYKLSQGRKLQLPAAMWPIAVAALTTVYLARPSFEVGWVCCLLLGIAAPQFQEITNPALRKTCNTLARYSYGIYLTHFICIWLALQALDGLPMWGRWIVLAAGLIVAPFLLYHGVEKPMIGDGGRVAEKVDRWRAACWRPRSAQASERVHEGSDL